MGAGTLFGAAAQAVVGGGFVLPPGGQGVAVGDVVTWTNSGAEGHTVSASDGAWGNNDLEPGDSYSHTFTAAGTYSYFCLVHDGMNGTITVQ